MLQEDFCNASIISTQVRTKNLPDAARADATIVFHSGFAEGSNSVIDLAGHAAADDTSSVTHIDTDTTDVEGDEEEPDHKYLKFEDSDDEDDYNDWGVDLSDVEDDEVEHNDPARQNSPHLASENDSIQEQVVPTEPAEINQDEREEEPQKEDNEDGEEERNVRRKLSHPSSPRSTQPELPLIPPPQAQDFAPVVLPLGPQTRAEPKPVPGPSKVRVIIKDAPYVTYRAVLYYVRRCCKHQVPY